jgi:hypothetical protein
VICIVCHQREAEGLRKCRRCLEREQARIDGAADSARNDVPRETVSAAPPVKLTEVDVERQIMHVLKRRGWNVTKTSIRTHPKGATPGTPDLFASHPKLRRSIWIEVKTEEGVVSREQLEWHAKNRAAGVEVFVVFGVEELLTLMEEELVHG